MISEDVERVAQAMAEGAGFAWSACAQSQWIRDARIGLTAFFRNRVPIEAEVEETMQRMAINAPIVGRDALMKMACAALQASGAFIAAELEQCQTK